MALLSRRAAAPCKAQAPRRSRVAQVVRAAAVSSGEVPDMNKRNLMNLLLAGGTALPVGYLAYGYAAFFVPPSVGGGSGGQAAKDALGNDIKADSWLATHPKGDRSLSQGLKGDPTYLIVTNEGAIEKYGLNAVCTHLGCVVPWVGAENKFKCPCHGSQYNNEGKVVRGPAPLSLALAHTTIEESGLVTFTTWTETDFRTGEEPWWS